MDFFRTPGVFIRRRNLTTRADAVSTAAAAFVGEFPWGEVNKPVLVSNENQLIEKFGRPRTADDSYQFVSAASFFDYSQTLRVVRVGNNAMRNATSGGNGVLIENQDAFDGGIVADGPFAARHPGVFGNSIEVQICPAGANFTTWAFANLFDDAPGTSTWADDLDAENDEIHIVILDKLGKITGRPGAVLERFEFLSQARDARGQTGASIYYQTVINQRSNFIYSLAHPSLLTHAGKNVDTVVENDNGDFMDGITAAIVEDTLEGGTNGTNPDYIEAINVLRSDLIEINFVFTAADKVTSSEATAKANALLALASAREDTIACISPPLDVTVGNRGNEVADLQAFFEPLTSTPFGFFDSTAVEVFDRFDSRPIFIGASGHMAGLMARAEVAEAPWVSPAGQLHGRLLNVSRLAYNAPRADSDLFYNNKYRINPIVTRAGTGSGSILNGDRTASTQRDAFDRINVTRLFVAIAKQIRPLAEARKHRPNTEFNRSELRNSINAFLATVQARDGISDFKVICDQTNNDERTRANNQMVAEVFYVPVYSVNYIPIDLITTPEGVSFSLFSAN